MEKKVLIWPSFGSKTSRCYYSSSTSVFVLVCVCVCVFFEVPVISDESSETDSAEEESPSIKPSAKRAIKKRGRKPSNAEVTVQNKVSMNLHLIA